MICKKCKSNHVTTETVMDFKFFKCWVCGYQWKAGDRT